MKRYHLLVLHVVALFALAGCSNDDITQDKGTQESEGLTGMTEFAVKETPAPTSTRTMGIYSGSGIDFFWTSGDKLWINNPTAMPALIESTKDNISTLLAEGDGKKTATAKFYFSGTYTAPSYKVRYTGNGNTMGDKVTIKSVQNQATPNDGSHIGTDGDCGTAMATRGTDGKYYFTLTHRASYITFTPYYSHEFAKDVKVTQIKVTADETLAGEFNFNDNGLDLTNRPAATAANKSITLMLKGGLPKGFPIPMSPDYKENAAIMVLAPGTYNNFTVEYTIYDDATKVSGTVSRNYGTVTFHEGKNKKVAADLPVRHYSSDIYYMWDAVVGQHAWYGYDSYQPILNDGIDSHYPTSDSDARWYNPTMHPAFASRSAVNCPNANELRWYAEKGDPHWDPSIWSIMKHLYDGGMWLKKRSVIAKDNNKTLLDLKNAAPDKTDYTITSTDPKIYLKYVKSYTDIKLGKPANSSNYILLPLYGYYLAGNGKLSFLGKRGYYWSSTPRPDLNLNAYNLYVERNKVHVGYGDRTNAHCLWPE